MAKLSATQGNIVGPIIPNTVFNENDTVITPLTTTHMGILMVGVSEDNAVAFFAVENGSLSVVYANSLFTTNPSKPNKYYCFFDGGFFKVTNKVGDSKTIKISLFGLELR
jgi:hypothetical protein